ncbi:DNA cytosine methyltransferase|uniref:Cytosine-specific methyltransferase n=1 Tax=Dendrosporobacter quercicolus TaxID=146817 RepID=A0A1G9ZQD9_9FIRM|nr:DNA cytosine methyltransferase [Dendrosporobacter quercicolus]NSL49586.1 DNA cytosine methyltransferase [Dendrosporobacter quercicolus DSM 1736]SDN23782.1 DNA (cytosine-5)-methyltransferase 1 [Dendrosporobacter quercicolus]
MNSRFKVVSTFAGCGGSSLGYKLARGEVLLAVEWDNNAVATYRLNHPGTPVYHGDIAQLSVGEVLRITGLKPGELDLLDGSPPCQGFSMSGKRDADDDRNQLFREYVRLLQGLRPKVFVMENVSSGMVKGKMKVIFAEILRALKASGYRVKARLMNAKYFNVPQSRERMIFIGIREDLGIEPSHPRPQARPITVRQALRGCVPEEIPMLNEKYAAIWRRVPIGSDMGDALNLNGHYSDVVKLHPDRPSRTLVKTQTGRGFATLCHWEEPRAISIAEAKRLGSFPDDFQFIGSYSEQWARIGNSVPPLFMKAIAEHIRDNILLSA